MLSVSAPVRPVQISTPPTVIQKPAPAPAAQGRVQTPQVIVHYEDLFVLTRPLFNSG